MNRVAQFACHLAVLVALMVATAHAQQNEFRPKSDIPDDFEPVEIDDGVIRRVEMIPMRDGVKLKTIILVPEKAQNAPIILTRTPYNAEVFATRYPTGEIFAEEGYIRVFQDTRGKFGSEGDYILTRPVRGPLNSTDTDHTTDAWDTIDWLVKNVPESNRRVGMIGGSYNGFTSAMALLEPHPSLKAVVAEGPLIDAWMGDDWFHHGAFRQTMLGFVHRQTAQRGAGKVDERPALDDYENFLRAGSAGDFVRSNGMDKLPWIERTMENPEYNEYWQGQALDKILAERPSSVPTLWVQGLWDQEDTYGAHAAWRALKEAGRKSNNWLLMGPWSHVIRLNGATYGPFRWKRDTAYQYQREMLSPFMKEHLWNGASANLSRVTVYDTGKNRWERFLDWPSACQSGCASSLTPIYLQEDFGLSFEAPEETGSDAYISDPAKPIPFLPRPIVDPFSGILPGLYQRWSGWLVEDQRFVDGRPDVLTYETEVLDKEVHVQGIPVADIHAMTSGTDGDFVVKLIDVFPARYPKEPALGGYQVPIAMDIFRGRYRESFEDPSPIPANTPQRYRFQLPNVNHVFKPGHRIMVQIQSTMFPLYDRNPQKFVPNIFHAKPEDYQKAEITILRSKDQWSAVLLPVVNLAE